MDSNMTRRVSNVTLSSWAVLVWVVTDLLLRLEAALLDTPCCVVGSAVEGLPEPYRTAAAKIAETSARDGGWSADRAMLELEGAGLTVSASAITRHRSICATRTKRKGRDALVTT